MMPAKCAHQLGDQTIHLGFRGVLGEENVHLGRGHIVFFFRRVRILNRYITRQHLVDNKIIGPYDNHGWGLHRSARDLCRCDTKISALRKKRWGGARTSRLSPTRYPGCTPPRPSHIARPLRGARRGGRGKRPCSRVKAVSESPNSQAPCGLLVHVLVCLQLRRPPWAASKVCEPMAI